MKKVLFSLSVGLMFAMLPLGAAATPTTATLKYTYTPKGTLNLRVALDDGASGNCTLRVRTSLYYEGATRAQVESAVLSRVLRPNRKKARLVAKNLPGIVQKNNKDPIGAFQVQVQCGKTKVTSNAVARFLKCGKDAKRVSIQSFLTAVRKNLK